MLSYLTALIVIIPLVLIILFEYAFAIQILWGWFITPAFEWKIPPLATIAGLLILKGLIFSKNTSVFKKQDPREFFGSLIMAITAPLLALLVGGIIYWWF